MLIILSGVETVNKKYLARLIDGALNTYEVDGYKIDFSKHSYEVSDSEGNFLYTPYGHNSETHMFPNPEAATHNAYNIQEIVPPQELEPTPDFTEDIGTNTPVTGTDLLPPPDPINVPFEYPDAPTAPVSAATQEKINALYEEFAQHAVERWYRNMHVDILYDFGVTDKQIYDLEEAPEALAYNEFLLSYRNRTEEYFVICGSFSKGFVDTVRTDLGNENVTVLNIIRNPSVAYTAHKRNAAYYQHTPQSNPDIELRKLRSTLLNAASLARFDDIKTIRFEDLLNQQYLDLLGTRIVLPKDYYENHNGWITKFELENINQNMEPGEAEAVSNFNAEPTFKPLNGDIGDTAGEFIKALAEQYGRYFSVTDFDKVPRTVFGPLGYTPLTLEQVIS